MKSFICTLILFIVLSGCEKNNTEPNEDISSKYQPLGVGYSWTYQLDSIYFYGNISQDPDTFSHQIRNTITAQTENVDGTISYVINNEWKQDTSKVWTFLKKFTETRTSSDLRRTTGDRIDVVLSFPILVNKEWDGNQYNSENYVDCYIIEAHTPMTTIVATYDSTSTMICEQRINQLESFFTKETYAANIGLIKREVEALDNTSSSAGLKGPKYTWTLLSFEK